MEIPFYNLNSGRKLENAVIVTVLLLLFKIIFPVGNNFFSLAFNEAFVFIVLFFWYIYLRGKITEKSESPLSLVLNVAIISAKLFLLLFVSSTFFSPVSYVKSGSIAFSVAAAIIGSVFMGSGIYLFTVFRELFFLRQKKDPKIYFSLMVFFFVATYFSAFWVKVNPDLFFIKNSLFVVSVVLISINSIRVAWIAFLSKKLKLYLLGSSILLSGMFGINFAFTMDTTSLINQILVEFSPGVYAMVNLLMLYVTINFGVIFFTTLFHLPTAEAFDRKAKEVSSLADFSKMITQVFDFKELAESVTQTTMKVCNSDVAWLAVKGEDGFEIASAANIGYAEANKVMNALLIERSFRIEEVTILNHKSIKMSLGDSVRYLKFESLAIAPLLVHQNVSGYLFAGNIKYYTFDEDDEKTIGAFADYAAVALENSILFQESLEKERLEKELDVAREIQYKIIPNEVPHYPSLEIAASFVPAFEVGGDYYDFFEIDENRLGFVIADVSGKGISAAFVMAEVKGIFESLSKIIFEPKLLLDKVNDILIKSLTKKDFVTAIYGVIDVVKGTLLFARAGHPPVLLINEKETVELTPKGIGLGMNSDGKFAAITEQMEIKLNNNDIICLYTDGITEAQNAEYKNFGIENLELIIKKSAGDSLELLAQKVMAEVTTYSRELAQHDDITLLMFKWFNNNKNGES